MSKNIEFNMQKRPKPSDLLTIATLSAFCGLSPCAIRARVRKAKQGNGSFPLPVEIEPRLKVWIGRDVLTYFHCLEGTE